MVAKTSYCATATDVSLTGGGTTPHPGEISLAHNGILFLDELPEFRRNVLEVLRQPLEDGYIVVSRAKESITYPSKFMLIGSMNPCPCGFFGDRKKECHCTPPQIQKYVSKISGPLLDRIDIHIEVPSLPYKELSGETDAESSKIINPKILEEYAIFRVTPTNMIKSHTLKSRRDFGYLVPGILRIPRGRDLISWPLGQILLAKRAKSGLKTE